MLITYRESFFRWKMNHGLRYTYFRGQERVHRELTTLYAEMNLNQFSLHHYV